MDDLFRGTGRNPLLRQRRRLKRIALGLACVGVVAGLWLAVRAPLIWLWSDMYATFSSAFRGVPRTKLSAPVICTGVDAQGVPIAAADSFSEDEVSDTGLTVFLTYSGAVPGKTKFQMRWSFDNRVLNSEVRTLESPADSLYLKLGKNLPAGNHKIDFLVDGSVQQSAAIVIRTAGHQRAVHSAGRAKNGARDPHAGALPVKEVSPPEISTAAPISQPAAAELRPVRPPAQTVIVKARHRHALGSCLGELKLTPEKIEFTSEQHTFKFAVDEVKVNHEEIQDPSGKTWNFAGSDTNLETVLGNWKRGASSSAPAHTQACAPAAPEPPPSVRSYRALHKHRLGNCSGELRLTPDSIEFSSQQHYFKYEVDQVQIDGSGVRDRVGNTWRFDIPGDNGADLLRAWKNAKLFPNSSSNSD